MSLSAAEICTILESCGVSAAPEIADQLSAYLTLLLKWNARTNLTAVRDAEGIVRRHFADSLFCAQQIPASARSLLDFGSGAGFPGIPIVLVRPEVSVTLAESQNKKAAFLREAVRNLNLTAEVWNERVEAMGAARCFDAVTLRAVDRMLEACGMAAKRLRFGGQMLVFTTEAHVEELRIGVTGLSWGDGVRLPHSEHGLLLVGFSY